MHWAQDYQSNRISPSSLLCPAFWPSGQSVVSRLASNLIKTIGEAFPCAAASELGAGSVLHAAARRFGRLRSERVDVSLRIAATCQTSGFRSGCREFWPRLPPGFLARAAAGDRRCVLAPRRPSMRGASVWGPAVRRRVKGKWLHNRLSGSISLFKRGNCCWASRLFSADSNILILRGLQRLL